MTLQSDDKNGLKIKIWKSLSFSQKWDQNGAKLANVWQADHKTELKTDFIHTFKKIMISKSKKDIKNQLKKIWTINKIVAQEQLESNSWCKETLH